MNCQHKKPRINWIFQFFVVFPFTMLKAFYTVANDVFCTPFYIQQVFQGLYFKSKREK